MSERLVRFSLMDRIDQTEDSYLVCPQFGAVIKNLGKKSSRGSSLESVQILSGEIPRVLMGQTAL